jgi:hypothetical protein
MTHFTQREDTNLFGSNPYSPREKDKDSALRYPRFVVPIRPADDPTDRSNAP